MEAQESRPISKIFFGIEASDGDLKLHASKLVFILFAIATATSLMAYFDFSEASKSRTCDLPVKSYRKLWERSNTHPTPISQYLTFATHPGCFAEPVHTPRDRCPLCYRSEILDKFNDSQFTPLEMSVSPRGPVGFFNPREKPVTNLVSTVLVTPRDVCVESCPFLIALVLSRHFDNHVRNNIRKTWASVSKTNIWPGGAKLNAQIGVIFVLAWEAQTPEEIKNRKPHDMEQLMKEADVHGDILMMDMYDVYTNLTLKVASALSWAHEHCRTTKFFIKVDQDTFLNVPMLLDLLVYHQTRLKLSVTGYLLHKPRVYRVGRWGINSSSYPPFTYPDYAAGCAYILSRDATTRVLSLFPYYPYIFIEDMFITGFLARIAGLKLFSPSHREYFAEYSKSNRVNLCGFLEDKLITSTGVDTEIKIHRLFAYHYMKNDKCHRPDINDAKTMCWAEFPHKRRS